MSVYEQLKGIVAGQCDVNINTLMPSTNFERDLNFSMDIVEIIMAVEEKFDITMSDEEADEHCATMGEMAAFIERKLGRE